MGFTAADAVEELSWDFRPYYDAHGVTPEPSDVQIRRMNRGLRDAVKTATGSELPEDDQQALVKAFNALSDKQLAAIEEANIDAIVHVTGDCPSKDTLLACPLRIRRLYVRSLIRDLNSPEG